MQDISVRDLGRRLYADDGEGGVRGYGGQVWTYVRRFNASLSIKDKQRDAVIDTIVRGFPLNVMYWADRGDGTYEIIDGQQRTISIAQYVQGDFSHLPSVGGHLCFFDNLPSDKQAQILDYKLMIYVCKGTDSEKLDWFKTSQHRRGEADQTKSYVMLSTHGSWVSDAKRWFSRSGCAAHHIGQDYLEGISHPTRLI